MAGIKRAGAGLNSAQDLSQLVTSVNTSLAVLGSSSKAIYPQIAFVDDGSQTDGVPMGKVVGEFNNGDGSPGEVIKYGFSPVTNAPGVWSFGKDRDAVAETMSYLEITRERHAPADAYLYWDTQDVYGIISQKIPAILDRAGMLYDWLLAGMLNDNPVCYDGKNFFATDHWIDPSDHSKGVFSNDISISQLDEDGFGTALDAFASIPWMDGKARGSGSEKPLLVVPGKKLELKARNLVHGAMIPTATSTVHVAASSPFDGMVEDVLLFQALISERAVTNTPKYIYLINKGTPVKAGLIVAPKRHPLFHIMGLDPSEYCRVKQGRVEYGWDEFSGVGPGLPNDVVRIKVG